MLWFHTEVTLAPAAEAIKKREPLDIVKSYGLVFWAVCGDLGIDLTARPEIICLIIFLTPRSFWIIKPTRFK